MLVLTCYPFACCNGRCTGSHPRGSGFLEGGSSENPAYSCLFQESRSVLWLLQVSPLLNTPKFSPNRKGGVSLKSTSSTSCFSCRFSCVSKAFLRAIELCWFSLPINWRDVRMAAIASAGRLSSSLSL